MVGVSLSFETIQKSALLGSAHILRKVLEIKELFKLLRNYGNMGVDTSGF